MADCRQCAYMRNDPEMYLGEQCRDCGAYPLGGRPVPDPQRRKAAYTCEHVIAQDIRALPIDDGEEGV